VLDQVRFAAASLTSLVPMLAIERAPREDDLNSAIRELLGARLRRAGLAGNRGRQGTDGTDTAQ
jgi:hypothetical protein